MTEVNFECKEEFEKDLKKLLKKYRSLENDLEVLKKVIIVNPNGIPGKIVQISELGLLNSKVFKVRRFRCSSLKGTGSNSGMRVIYGYFINEPEKIIFIELYSKSEKENEDRTRIEKYFN